MIHLYWSIGKSILEKQIGEGWGTKIIEYMISFFKPIWTHLKFLQGSRGHWQVENTLHHVKDRSWGEDKMYSKVPEQGSVLGKLKNQALNVVRTLAEKLGWKEESMPKWSAQLLSRSKWTLALMSDL